MTDIVECHSGSAYAERPTALTWQGQRLIIAEILSQGRTPKAKWFRVRTTDGQVFELSYVDAADERPSEHEWQIHQF
ncbi:MAG: hypothetical protein IMZ73_05955 [Chloroflexi bacterium]|jgi:hypothetical protein|nr:hypothetical protein [Chloroflexota bacterium]